MKSVLLKRELAWRENRQGTRHKLPHDVQSWVYESGSLTQRLRDAYGEAVVVELLRQQWSKPFISEQQLLQQPENRYCLSREVLLKAHDTPLILARTLIPSATIKAANSNLAQLGTRPLGEILFAHPQLARLAMDIVLVTPSQWQTAIAKTIPIQHPVGGRRTVYALKHKALLGGAFFLSTAL